jgi:DNA (cytosine-5)-methyltransferase 1
VPVALGGSGKLKKTRHPRHGPHDGPRAPLSVSLRAQGLPEDFLDECPFTMEGKRHAIGNGVPIPMGRAVARAVKAALKRKVVTHGGDRSPHPRDPR